MKHNTKIKVLYLITKSNWGGAQRYVFDLATNLDRERFEPAVALGGDGPLAQHLSTAGIRVIPIPGLQRDVSLRQELTAGRSLAHIIKTEQPDILHVNSSKAGAIGTIVGRLYRVPNVIFTAHGWAFNEDRPGWQRFLVKIIHWLTVLFSHTTIAVSHMTKRQLNWPWVQSKMVVVHNGRAVVDFLDRDNARVWYESIVPQLATTHEHLWIGTIAELHPVKRHDLMIAAVAKLVAEGHQLRHLIIGDGELRRALAKQIADANLQNHIFLLGHQHEAARYLKALDIFVLTSRSEALAYTVIEAAQAGLPIVATRVGGIPEIIADDQTGLLVPSQDATALTDALRTLLTDAKVRNRLGMAAYTRSQHFSIERLTNETITVYNS